MDLKEYKDIREKIRNKDFEGKNKKLDWFLFLFSWIGNVGSIFFAYFLVFPAFLKAISANLVDGTGATVLSSILSILVLGIIELIKRETLSNLSFDLIQHKYKITKKFIGFTILGFGLISASFYFSLNGAINFATTSGEKNIVVEQNVDMEIDSLTHIYIGYKEPYLLDNTDLREDNNSLRDKISETPLNYRAVRNDYQAIINSNLETIKINDEKIAKLDSELKEKISNLQIELDETKQDNENRDVEGILLFLIVSTSIELIIILGVFFRQFYEYNTYLINEAELEDVMITRERYNTLIKFLYKEGTVGIGEQIMGASKLKEIVGKRSKIPSHSKFVDQFISDVTYMGILRLEGKRRYTATSYDDALQKIEKFDDTLRLLEKLK